MVKQAVKIMREECYDRTHACYESWRLVERQQLLLADASISTTSIERDVYFSSLRGRNLEISSVFVMFRIKENTYGIRHTGKFSCMF